MKKEKMYTFTQAQLEGFVCFVLVDSMEHPNSSIKGVIRRVYQADKKRSNKDKSKANRSGKNAKD